MKFLLFILLGFTLPGKSPDIYAHSKTTEAAVIDTSVYNYYPLKIGNKWIWNINRNVNPGPGYKSALITGTQIIRNHLYYKFKIETYIIYMNQYSLGYDYMRVDSTTGNLYNLNLGTFDTTECLSDSLMTPENDSAYIYCGTSSGRWIIHSKSSYNFNNQNYPSENFSWPGSFESCSYHIYISCIGMVYYRYQSHTSYYEEVLKGCVINGFLHGDTTFPLGIAQINNEVPDKFKLYQNYPNPFNPVTNIKFSIPISGFVKLAIYDMLGKEIELLVNSELNPGTYQADWDASIYPSGVYCYRLESDYFSETKKMVLIK